MKCGKGDVILELNKSNIRKIMGIIAAALLFYWGLNHIEAILEVFSSLTAVFAPFLLGLCLAFIINVILRRVETIWDQLAGKKTGRRLKRVKRPVCLLLSLGLMTGVIFIILFMVIPELQKNVMMIIDMLPQYANYVMEWWDEMGENLLKYGIILPDANFNSNEIGKVISEFLSESGGFFLDKTMDVTVSIFASLVNGVLGLVFAIYVLLQKEKLALQMKKLLFAAGPENLVKPVISLMALANDVFTKFVTGQFTEAVIIGLLCFLGMVLLQIPYAAVISVLVGFSALIPIFGAFLGTAVGAFLILVLSPFKALEFIIFIIVLQQLEGNIIYPKVVGKSVGLPGIWVLMAVTVGGSLFGVFGMLLGVPVCSVLYCVVKEAVHHELKKKGIKVV